MPKKEIELDLESFFIGQSPVIQKLKETVSRIIPTDLPVLILGETGVGSTHLARLIHQDSKRSNGPFVTVSLASLPSSLASSELFGHEKGAFTGANTMKRGLIEIAHNGTLVLDEIESASTDMQAVLLRFLENRTVRPIGSTRERHVDVRIIITARPNIMHSESVRQDFLTRVAGITISIPPLRQRPGDIKALAMHILKVDGFGKSLDNSAMDALSRHLFPGNVRELRIILSRAVALSDSDILTEADLMLPLPEPVPSKGETEDVKRDLQVARGELDAMRRISIVASPIWEGRSFPLEKRLLLHFDAVR